MSHLRVNTSHNRSTSATPQEAGSMEEGANEPSKKWECGKCEYRTNHKSHFNVHKLTHLSEADKNKIKTFVCEVCGLRMRSAAIHRNHMTTHTGEKRFKCKQCPAAFSQSGSFTIHKRSHTGERPYECDRCEKTFTNRKDLTAHTETHDNLKLNVCDMCDFRTNNASNLRTHRRTHSNEKRYSCNFCPYTAYVKAHMRFHLTTHDPNRARVPCKEAECDRTFSSVSAMNKHCEVKHNKSNGDVMLSCTTPGCEFKTKYAPTMQQHKFVHMDPTLFCSECAYRTTRRGDLKRHVQCHGKTQPMTDRVLVPGVKKTDFTLLPQPIDVSGMAL